MHPEQVKEIFDQQASPYDKQWAKLAPLRDALHLLTGAVFSELPIESRVLFCVGAGTGAEVIYFAQRFPRWTFTAVEPSGRMLDMCRRKRRNAVSSIVAPFTKAFSTRCHQRSHLMLPLAFWYLSSFLSEKFAPSSSVRLRSACDQAQSWQVPI